MSICTNQRKHYKQEILKIQLKLECSFYTWQRSAKAETVRPPSRVEGNYSVTIFTIVKLKRTNLSRQNNLLSFFLNQPKLVNIFCSNKKSEATYLFLWVFIFIYLLFNRIWNALTVLEIIWHLEDQDSVRTWQSERCF